MPARSVVALPLTSDSILDHISAKRWWILLQYGSYIKFWGHLEAAVALEAIKVAHTGNMHMDFRVAEVPDYKSYVKFDPYGCNHCCQLICEAIALLLPF